LGIQVTVNRDRTAVKTSLQTPEISNCKYITLPVASIASLHINSQTKVMHTRTNKDTTSHLWI